MAAGDLTVTGNVTASSGTGTFNKVAVTDTVVVTNLNADKVDGADKDTDTSLAANSDAKVPSQKAVKSYIDTKDAQNAKLTGNQSIAGEKTFSTKIIDKNGHEVLGLTFESQHFDESWNTVVSTWTQRSHVFTFSGNPDAVINVELNVGWDRNYPIWWYIDAVTISTNQVTVTWKYWCGMADHTAYASIEICAVY